MTNPFKRRTISIRRVTTWLVAASLLIGCSSTALPPLPDTTESGGDDTLRVAVLTPMTGELATFGETVRDGVELALDLWNARGGVNGRQVEWILADTECDPAAARQVSEQVIDEGVDFLVGGLCSGSAIAVASVAQERQALFVAVAATHPLVTVDGQGTTRRLVFRTAYEYTYQAAAAASFALAERAASQALIIADPADAFERQASAVFAVDFAAQGGRVASLDPQSLEPEQVALALDQFDQRQPIVVYVPGDPAVAVPVLSVLAGSIVLGSDVWQRTEADLNLLNGAYVTDHYTPEIPDDFARAWASQYQNAFAQQPETLSVLGYDSANLLLSAIDAAQSQAPQTVAHWIETNPYRGVVGTWRYDDRHNPLKDVILLQVQDGGFEFAGRISLIDLVE